MSEMTTDPLFEETDEERVRNMQAELALMLGQRVTERVVEPTRRASRGALLARQGPVPPTVIELDAGIVDALTLVIDQSIERLLPGLLEEVVARVLPGAIDAAITDIVEALSSSAPTTEPITDRAANTLRSLRRAWAT